MKKRTSLVIGLGVLIVVLVLVGFLWPVTKTGTPPVPVVTELKTYTNTIDNFSIAHPAQAQFIDSDPNSAYIAQAIHSPVSALSILIPRVDTFSENGSHGYYEFQIRILATDPLAKCSTQVSPKELNEMLTGTTTFAGETASVFTSSDAGAGNRVTITRYAVCHNDIYYSVSNVFATGSDGTPLTPKLEADIAAGKAQSEAMIKSFAFTK